MKELIALETLTEAVTLQISDLIFTVKPVSTEFYQSIKTELRSGNLVYPIVAVYTTGAEWNRLMRPQNVLRLAPTDDDQMYYFVTCGNNRGRVARELGYTHISSIVVPTFDAGSDYCKQMRKWYDKKCGRRNRE